jgi:hypothetical protein
VNPKFIIIAGSSNEESVPIKIGERKNTQTFHISLLVTF